MDLALLVVLGVLLVLALGAWLRSYLERHDAELDREWLEEQRRRDVDTREP